MPPSAVNPHTACRDNAVTSDSARRDKIARVTVSALICHEYVTAENAHQSVVLIGLSRRHARTTTPREVRIAKMNTRGARVGLLRSFFVASGKNGKSDLPPVRNLFDSSL